MSQGSLKPKFRFLAQKLWSVARLQRLRQTDIHKTDYCGHPFRVSGVFDFLQPAIPSNIRLLKFDMSTDFYFNGTLIRNPKVMWDSMGASLWVISGCELLQRSYLPKWQVNIFFTCQMKYLLLRILALKKAMYFYLRPADCWIYCWIRVWFCRWEIVECNLFCLICLIFF